MRQFWLMKAIDMFFCVLQMPMNRPPDAEVVQPPLQPDVETSEVDQAPPRDPGTMAGRDTVMDEPPQLPLLTMSPSTMRTLDEVVS